MAGYTQDGHIGLANLEAFVWTMTAITILLSAGRYAISVAEGKSLQWDNLTHVLALLAMVTMVALFQTLFRDGYYITAIDRQMAPIPDKSAFVELYIRFRRRSDAIALLFFTSTWLVKLTFLLYYRRIFKRDKNFEKAWWAVTIFVFITYWVTFAAVLTQCGPAKNSFSLVQCTTPGSLRYGKQLLKYTCAVSVATDVAVIALPIWMLKDLKIRTPQKAGVAAMFSLGVIIVVFEILRTIKSLEQTTFSEVAIYDVVENAVALIVSSITHYRLFLSAHYRKQADRRYLNLRGPSKSVGARSSSHSLKLIRDGNTSETTGKQSASSAPHSQYVEDSPDSLVRAPELVHV